MDEYKNIVAALQEPFDPKIVQWKPGAVSKDKTRAMAMAYVDSRAYMERLDEVAPGWEDEYEFFDLRDRVVVLCHLTVAGVTRTGDGEALLVDGKGEPDPNAVTSASAQAFKRACAKHGLGRYLYDLPRVWVDYDAERRYFTRDALAELLALLTDGTPPKSTQARASTGGNGKNGNGKNGNGKRDARQIQVKFGKYNGQTLGEIAKNDPDYLEWLAENWQWETGRRAAAAVLAHIRKAAEKAEEQAEAAEAPPF